MFEIIFTNTAPSTVLTLGYTSLITLTFILAAIASFAATNLSSSVDRLGMLINPSAMTSGTKSVWSEFDRRPSPSASLLVKRYSNTIGTAMVSSQYTWMLSLAAMAPVKYPPFSPVTLGIASFGILLMLAHHVQMRGVLARVATLTGSPDSPAASAPEKAPPALFASLQKPATMLVGLVVDSRLHNA